MRLPVVVLGLAVMLAVSSCGGSDSHPSAGSGSSVTGAASQHAVPTSTSPAATSVASATPAVAPATAGQPSAAASARASQPTASTSPTTAPSTPTAAPQAGKPLTAEQVVAGIVSRVQSARAGLKYTASNDPNQLLGRPGGYTSKQAFTDTRVAASKAQDSSPGSVDLGGSVEVFPSESAARQRGQYIQRAEAATGFLSHEYDYTSGGALLRVSAVLTPDEAKAYGDALGRVTGLQSTAVTS